MRWNLSQTEPGHDGNLSLAENFCGPKDPNVTHLYETELACKEEEEEEKKTLAVLL